jgi:hypothetical protein
MLSGIFAPPDSDSEGGEFEGDEDLPPFWLAINGRDQKHWYV